MAPSSGASAKAPTGLGSSEKVRAGPGDTAARLEGGTTESPEDKVEGPVDEGGGGSRMTTGVMGDVWWTITGGVADCTV